MTKIINSLLIFALSLSLVACDVDTSNDTADETIEEITEEVIDEPTSYTVELDELQTQIINEMNLDILSGLGNDNGDGTSTYEIQYNDKDELLKVLDMWFDADLLCIWADNNYIEKVHHSKDYQLTKIYLNETSITTQEEFTNLYAKRIFEYGLIYNKFDEKKSWIFIAFYDSNGNKINQIDSDMIDL